MMKNIIVKFGFQLRKNNNINYNKYDKYNKKSKSETIDK